MQVIHRNVTGLFMLKAARPFNHSNLSFMLRRFNTTERAVLSNIIPLSQQDTNIPIWSVKS